MKGLVFCPIDCKRNGVQFASEKDIYHNRKHYDAYTQSGDMFYAAPKPGETVNLTEVLFPGVISNMPKNQILNITFDCTTKRLEAHTEISSRVEVNPGILGFDSVVLSLALTLDSAINFRTILLSSDTQLFSLATFVAVRYDFNTGDVMIKGIPIDVSTLSVTDALRAVSGTNLPIPSGISEISDVNFIGKEESEITTIVIRGKSDINTVKIVLQKSSLNTTAALMADLHNFNLATFVSNILHVDILSVPVFGTLQVPQLGFSAATGSISSSLLPMVYASGSPLELYGTIIPKSVSAYFTVDIAGVSLSASFSLSRFSFKASSMKVLSVKQLLDQIPNIGNLDSLPALMNNVLNSQLSGFIFEPETKQLFLGLMLPELTLIPNMLNLTNVDFTVTATLSQNPSIQNLQFSGTWKFSTVSLATNVEYDRQNSVLNVKATPEENGTSLNIDSLIKNVAGVGSSLPSALTSLSLSSVVGNIYNNGNYFIAMSGTVTRGNIYLIFFKDAEGIKVGIAASVQSFQFSSLVEGTVGVDITDVPYFGSLLVPVMALSITSGVIKSPALPHLFGQESPLLAFGDTLPAGVSSQFDLNVGKIKGTAKYSTGVLAFYLPDSIQLSVQDLASVIPSIGDAIHSLPSQMKGILSANLNMFSFNSTSKDLSFTASINMLTLVSGLLTLSNVSINYDGTFGQTLSTTTLDFMGTWHIGEYAILTSATCDGLSKELVIASQSSEKNVSISSLFQNLAGTTISLPSAISSFALTRIVGKTAADTALIVLNGRVGGGNGKISAVFQKMPSENVGAIIIDIMNFKLSELVESTTGVDISDIPFFGTLEIPELKFSAATSNITTPLLRELASTGSALEWFNTGIVQGTSGRFVTLIGNSKIAANFIHQKLNFKIPATSSLSLSSILSVIPDINNALSTLPAQLSIILDARIAYFSFDPASHQLMFSGSLQETVELVPEFLSLANVKISLVLVLSTQKYIETLDLMGDWNLKDLKIHTLVSYNRAENRLDITGGLDEANGSVSIPELITSLSGKTLPVPSVLSSARLSKLFANIIGDITLVSFTGSVENGQVFLIYQKSTTESAVAFAADTRKFKFSSLVSSSTGIDITSVPFFGSLEIPQIALTIASMHIRNPLFSQLFPVSSPLANFSSSIYKGVTAAFSVSIGDVKVIAANFIKDELNLQVPDSVDLSITDIVQVIPGFQNLINSLPTTIQSIGGTRLSKLYFIPTTKEFQIIGSLDSLEIIPSLLSLKNIELGFSGIIGKGSKVVFVRFNGDWIINSLALTTKVFYENNLLLISGSSAEDKSLIIEEFIKGLTGTELDVPSTLNAFKFTKFTGKIQNGAFSLVLYGEIGAKANVSIVYEQSREDGKTVAFAADIKEFQLAELVQAGAGVDITDVPFFGEMTIPTISFIVSTQQFTTLNLPDLNITGIHVPKELLSDNIPAGVKGHFIVDIGSAIGLQADFVENILTIEVPSSTSLSLSSLLMVIPDIKSTIDSLPDRVEDILNAEITKLVFEPTSKVLYITMKLDSLTLIPDVLSIQGLRISLGTSFSSSQLQSKDIIGDLSFYEYPLTYNNPKPNSQAFTLFTFDISGTWVLHRVEIQTTIVYDRETKVFRINGIGTHGKIISTADIIQTFSSTSVVLPSVLSSIIIDSVVATSSDDETTIVFSAKAGNTNVYLLYQVQPYIISTTAMAVAAEIQAFKLVDLIFIATGLDLTGTPFIGSFVISSMAFSTSTNPLTTPLLATFNEDSPLHIYSNTLPKGVTAHFEVQIGGKMGISVTYEDKVLQFVTPENISLSLSDLLSEIPSISSAVNTLPSPIGDLRTATLQAMDFDVPTKTLSAAASLDQLTIIPNKMVVTNLHVSFIAILSSSNGGLESLDFTADWILGPYNIRVKVTYDKVSKLVVFAALPTGGLTIQQLINSLTGSSIGIPSSISSVNLTKIVGRKTSSVSTIIFSGVIANRADVHLVYQIIGRSSQVGIAAGIKSFTLSELIQSAVKIDISSVPFFGMFSAPSLALAIADVKITSALLPEVFAADSPLIRYDNTIPKGFTAKFDAPIGNIRGIIGSFSDHVISFTVPSNVDASLGSLVSLIPEVESDVSSIDIGQMFGNILNIQMKSFTFNVQVKALRIELFMEQVTFYEDILSVRDIELILSATFSPKSLTAEANGIITLDDTDYSVSVGKDTVRNNYVLTVEAQNLPILGILTALGATFLPDDLQTILENVFKINILNARVVYPIGVQPQKIYISGTPEIFGIRTAALTAVAIRHGDKIRLIQKYDFGTINIADVIENLVGVSLHKLKLLDQSVDLTFILSPSTITEVSIPEFEGFSLNQGITIKAPLEWPSDCSSDVFCNVAHELLNGAKLDLEGTIANARSFTITATIGDLPLGGGVVLLHAGMQFVSGANPSVGIVGSLELNNPDITLMAAIRVSIGGVKLEGSMSDCWYNAFGSSYLTLCNLFLSITITPSPLPISGLEFGGRIEVGKQSCGRIVAEAYVGLNSLNPSENYFYADVGPLTFQTFFDAFCLNMDLPKPLADSGFPNGFKTSFSLLGRELPHAGIIIPPGYRFRGTINILGLEAYADIYIQLPARITAKINLPPLSIASFLKMYRSRTDTSAGPYLSVDITPGKAPTIEAEGYVNVFGISVETKLLISSQKYEFEISGMFLNLFEANLRIAAEYSSSITSGRFEVEGWFKSDLFERIAHAVRDGLTKSADEADKHIGYAQEKIDEAQAELDEVFDDLENVKRDVDRAQSVFDDAIAEVEHARHQVDGICSYRSCGSVCVGCPSGWVCCGTVWGTCVCTHPGWNSCCTRITDPLCLTANAACALLKEPLDFILQGAIVVVDASRVTLEIVKGVLSVAQGVVLAARETLEITKIGLDAVRIAYRVGVNAVSALTNFVLTQIINIHEIYFKVELGEAEKGKFQCRVKGILVGQSVDLELYIDTGDILSIAKSLGERAVSGISDFIG